MNTPRRLVEIVPYRETWADDFREIAVPLRRTLEGLALRIDHIGSTAVRGLAAKDVIDVQITVSALLPEIEIALSELGYSRAEAIVSDHRPPGAEGPADDWAKWYFRAPSEQRPTNLHVRVERRPNQRYPLLFRDFLRRHDRMATAYAELKRRLAERLPEWDDYVEVKDPAVDLIYAAAEDWASLSSWRPGGSDA